MTVQHKPSSFQQPKRSALSIDKKRLAYGHNGFYNIMG